MSSDLFKIIGVIKKILEPTCRIRITQSANVEKEDGMKRNTFVFALVVAAMVVVGCSSEKEPQIQTVAPVEEVKALTSADKQKIKKFRDGLFDIEKVSGKALAIVGDEMKLMAKGEKGALDVASLVEKAKTESAKSLDKFMKETVPGTLPPWFSRNLAEAKNGFVGGYKAKLESFEAVKKSIEEKNPMALLEYKQKDAQAQKLLGDANSRLRAVLAAAGIPAGSETNAGEKQQ